MKIIIACIILLSAHNAIAQQSMYGIRMQDASGHVLTINGPVSGFTSNYNFRFPLLGSGLGSLLYTNDALGQLAWLNPGVSGYILSLSGGVPVWSDPALILGASYWSLAGNATATAYNGAAGSYLGTTSLFPLVLATTNATAQPIEFFNGGLERMRIASSGQLLIGTTTPLATLTVNGETYSNTFLTQVNTAKPAYSEGRFFYDTAEKTMAYYNDHNGVTLNVGQEEWIRVYNATGASIVNGSAVYINGVNAATGLPTVALAKADQLTTVDAIGITTETIPTGSFGYVTAFGVIHQLNTTAYTVGQPIYVSATTAGALTSTRPSQPNFTNPIGYIAASDAVLGKILVMAGKSRQGAMTKGAVAFGGADGFIKENPTSLFFDSTNVRLGIGTNIPASTLTVNGETYSNTFLAQVNTSKPAYAEGRFFYDTAEKTMAYYNDHNGVTLNVGQEEWVRVYNATGASILNGSAVYINGVNAATGLPTVALAKADLIATADAIGITTETILTGNFGYVTAFGVIHNLNTTAYTAGQPIYVSATTAGAVTSTRPIQPNFTNPIGYIAATDAVLGKILVMAGKSRQGAMTTGAVAFGGTDGFIKENPTNLFWDNTNLRFGIGTNAPASPLTVTAPITASGGSGIGSLLNQTITAAANNDVLYGINITPTFTNGAFTGLTNYSLRSVYAGTLANSAALRGEATGNAGASTEVIGVWGIATNATQGTFTNAGVGIRAEGNNTTTDANTNTALQVVNGGIIVGRQASSAVNDNSAGNNILAAGEDDNNGLTDQGPSGVVDVTTARTLGGNSDGNNAVKVIFNRYAKSNSIIILTVMTGGTATFDPTETVTARVSARAASTFTIDVARLTPSTNGGTQTAGTVRVGFLIINPGKE